MLEFFNWAKQYIKDFFDNDNDIKKEVVVENANKKGNELNATNTPQIQVQILNDSENERYSTFYEGENITTITLQITSYTQNMKIKNEMTSAQEVSIIFADKIKTLFQAKRVCEENTNIKRCYIRTTSPAMPLQDGKVYATAVRCEFWVQYPYNKI